jgi:hypothetical protein
MKLEKGGGMVRWNPVYWLQSSQLAPVIMPTAKPAPWIIAFTVLALLWLALTGLLLCGIGRNGVLEKRLDNNGLKYLLGKDL